MDEEAEYRKVAEYYERKPKATCPQCKSNEFSVPVAYGFPGDELLRLAEEGKVQLMGCVMSEEEPAGYCHKCDLLIP